MREQNILRQALLGALRGHRLGGMEGVWLQSSHCTELCLLEGNHNLVICSLSAQSSLFQLARAECGGEAQLMFPSLKSV